jgi:hypothetical protein
MQTSMPSFKELLASALLSERWGLKLACAN